MAPVATGRCQCGRIEFAATGAPRDTHFCHCTMCRRAVGNAFATLVWFDASQIAWRSGPPDLYRSSAIAQRGFCSRCGTPMSLHYDDSRSIALMVGTFDDAAPYTPSHHYGIEARLPWVDIGRDLPGQPTEKNPKPE